MACLECGLEQAGDAGTCGRCSAPLPGAEHPPGILAGQDNAAVTGGKVRRGLPGINLDRGSAGLYHDPAGGPGLREWTGTGWSPFLHVDPGASGYPGRETGPARIWSPLSPGGLHRHSRAIMADTRRRTALSWGGVGLLTLALVLIAVLVASGRLTGSWVQQLIGWTGTAWFWCLAGGVDCVRYARRWRTIALALSAAATPALPQDDPPTPVEPAGLRTK
jgi:hypothetical protein